MQTLIISTPEVRKQVERQLATEDKLIWADCLRGAIDELEETDIDAVIYDGRAPWKTSHVEDNPELKALLAKLSVTTRVMAIVEQLPVEDFFAESGVIYLTPPVNLDDIRWFISSQA
ncbi:MAG: hypothetical protein ISP91_10480 [Pseudomonadales bacterium]|nr:hypothetical protein [Pseudomonadales bacterium]